MERKHVLVVEDDAALSELVSEVLTDAGYNPLVVTDHARIPEAVDSWHPRCVLLDGEAPSTGATRSWRDAAALRRAHPALPVLLFTADADAEAEARAGRSYRSRAAAFAGIVTKPFLVEELLETVNSAIERSAKTDVIAMIVHELRQPLAAIRGQAQLARRRVGQDPDGERRAMDQAVVHVDRMTALVDQLLDHARLEADRFDLDLVVMDLSSAVAAAIAAHGPDASDRITLEAPAGAIPIEGDPVRITQIVENLLSNAIKYSAATTPIEVSITTDSLEAQVCVTDHGVGVPDSERALLFTPFYRTARTRGIRGTGLGLHISRKLAERHGGRLWLDDSSSAGSVFVFALPLARSGLPPGARPS